MALNRTATKPRTPIKSSTPTAPKAATPGRSLEARARALVTQASANHGALFYAAVDDGDERAVAPLLARAAKGDADLYAAAMVQLFGGTRADHPLPTPAAPTKK